MDALLSVYGDEWTEHGDSLAALAPATSFALVAGGAPGGGRVSCVALAACVALPAGGGRWSGSALRGRSGERTGAAPVGATDGAAPGRAAAAG